MKKFVLIFFFLNSLLVISQVKLNGNIGSFVRPDDNDSIQSFPSPKEMAKAKVLSVGDKIPQFRLYGLNNDSLDIASELNKGKPVCLISGSYACPVYRSTAHHVDSLQRFFKNRISFFMIYVPEAHPLSPDICPYTGEVWDLSDIGFSFNQKQARTYGERKLAAKKLVKEGLTQSPVFIDGPDNSWWTNFALSPSVVYLILPNGSVYSKYEFTKAEEGKSKGDNAVKLMKDLISLSR